MTFHDSLTGISDPGTEAGQVGVLLRREGL